MRKRHKEIVSYLSVWKASGKRTAPKEDSIMPSTRVGSAVGHIQSAERE